MKITATEVPGEHLKLWGEMAWEAVGEARYANLKLEGKTKHGHKKYIEMSQACTEKDNVGRRETSEVPGGHLNM